MATYRVKFYFFVSILAGIFVATHSARAEGPAPTLTPQQIEEQKREERRLLRAEKRAERMQAEKLKNSKDASTSNKKKTKSVKKSTDQEGSKPTENDDKEDLQPAKKYRKVGDDWDVSDNTEVKTNLEAWNAEKSTSPKSDAECVKNGKFVGVHYQASHETICLPKNVDGKDTWAVKQPPKGTNPRMQVCNLTESKPNLMPSYAMILYSDDACETLQDIDIKERKIAPGKCMTFDATKSFQVLYKSQVADCELKNPANANKSEKDTWEEEYRKQQKRDEETIKPSPTVPPSIPGPDVKQGN